MDPLVLNLSLVLRQVDRRRMRQNASRQGHCHGSFAKFSICKRPRAAQQIRRRERKSRSDDLCVRHFCLLVAYFPRRARSSAPCLIFFDEVDALCPRRDTQSDSAVSQRLVNQMLTELDGLDTRNEVFVVAASNRFVSDPFHLTSLMC